MFITKRLALFFCGLCSFSTFAQPIALGEIAILNESGQGSARPQIVIANTQPLAMWTKSSNPKAIFVRRFIDGAWQPTQQISGDDLSVQTGSSIGPVIAAKNNQVLVAYITADNKNVIVQQSIDGGVNFSAPQVAYAGGANLCEGLDAHLLPDGNPVVAFENYDAGWTNARQVVIRSFDNGETYIAPVIIDNHPCECCTPLLTGNSSQYGVVYRNNVNNVRTFYASFSPNNDNAFSSPYEVDNTSWYIGACPASAAAAALQENNTLFTAWMSGGDGMARLYWSNAETGTETVTPAASIDWETGYGVQKNPSAATSGEFQLVAWEEAREIVSDCFMAVMVDGETVGGSFPVSTGDAFGSCGNPHLVYDGANGLFHLVYRNQSADNVVYRTVAVVVGFVDAAQPLALYPNPATSKIHLSGQASKHVVVQNNLGQTVLTATNQQEISVAALPAGKYTVLVRTEKDFFLKTFVKQ